jgi:predicted metalloprotease
MRGPIGIAGVLVVVALSILTGRNLFEDVGIAPGVVSQTRPLSPEDSAREEQSIQFVSFVLDDTQETWSQLLPGYQDAKLVVFRDAVQSGCGVGQAAMGPFYCALDQRVYIDLGFFDELDRRFEAPGDFAQAYVLAHEIGHHVQNLSGTHDRVRELQQTQPRAANELSVRVELQADCYAGVWGHSTGQRRLLETGDVEEGLAAASAVGDDRIQQRTSGGINVDAFTHGSAAQRSAWFRRGLTSGDPRSCDTFAGAI